MIDTLKRVAQKNRFFYYSIYIAYFICSGFVSFLFIVMRIFPIQKKKIVCCGTKGKRYGDNPKYIVDELKKSYPEYEVVWMLRSNSKTEIPNYIKIVNHDIWHMVYELATAQFWIDTNTKLTGVLKRKGQYYIQTWHGSYGLKKLGADFLHPQSFIDIKGIKEDAKLWDLLLSNSRMTTEIYRRSLWYSGEILECGSPRNDIFFKEYESYINKVKVFFHIQKKRMILYAPTFRSDFKIDQYHLDFMQLLNNAKNKFGDEWVVLVRLHPNNIRDAEEFIEYNDSIINATNYSDVQELLVACDILISDYSSCMFDFATKKAPCFIYATDVEKYKSERDFYFDIFDLPFPVAENNDQLQQNILQFDEKKYEDKLQNLFEGVGLCDTGSASKKVVEWIADHT